MPLPDPLGLGRNGHRCHIQAALAELAKHFEP
jgi:hypothetical protein